MAKEVNKKKALGLGIKALLNNIDDELKSGGESSSNTLSTDKSLNQMIGLIDINEISINPKQPRKDFDEGALGELSESIKLHGIIQPITVSRLADGKYQLISGERRLRASKIANLKKIPAFIRTVSDNQELIELALLENLQREDLNPMEIAISYKQLMDECLLTQEQVADRMNKQRSTVANYLRLLKLPPDIQKAVVNDLLSMGHARAIIGLQNVDEQLYAYRETVEKGLSVRQVEALVKSLSSTANNEVSKKTPRNTLPPAYKRIEDDMASLFATKVKLDRKKNGKGAISIEFYSDEDLERIMEAMNI